MFINPPCIITSRLLPGIKVGDATISIERDGETFDNRDRFRIYIDAPGIEYVSEDQASGVGGGSMQDALRATLSFLSACGESRNYRLRQSVERHPNDTEDLYPADVAEWASQNADALGLAECELEETTNAIEE